MIHVDPADPAVLDHLVESLDDEIGNGIRDLARAALAALEDVSTAGWSRPRVVTTADELFALPSRTTILHESGLVYRRTIDDNFDGWTVAFEQPQDMWVWTDELAGLPYVVVWSPPVESGETQGGAR